jgi:tetratricopeptide (TPR) repeat protein
VLRATQRYPEAIHRYSQAINLLGELATQFSDHPEYRLELAVAYSNRGNLHQTIRDTQASRSDYDEACKLLRRLVNDHPHAPLPRQELANTFNSLAAMLSGTDSLEAAERTWSEAAVLLRDLVSEHSSIPVYHGDLGMTLGNLGWALAAQKKFEAARERLLEGIRELETALEANREHPDYVLSLRAQLQELAQVFLELGDHVAAASAAQQIAELRSGSPADAVVAACLLVRSASLAEQDAELTASSREQTVDRYDEQAAELVRTAVREKFNDQLLLEQTRPVFAKRLDRHEGLREAFSQLEAQASPTAAH